MYIAFFRGWHCARLTAYLESDDYSYKRLPVVGSAFP